MKSKRKFPLARLITSLALSLSLLPYSNNFRPLPAKAETTINEEVGIATFDALGNVTNFTPQSDFDLGEKAYIRVGVQGKTATVRNKSDSILALDASNSMNDWWGDYTPYRQSDSYEGITTNVREPATLAAFVQNDDWQWVGSNVSWSDEDGEESGGVVNITGEQLLVGKNLVGLYFYNVGIKRGQTIEEADLRFTSNSTNATPTVIDIYAEKSADPAELTTQLLSTRTLTTNKVRWTMGSWTNDYSYESPSLIPVINEVTSMSSWPVDGGGSILLLLKPISGQKEARAWDKLETFTCEDCKPTLHVNYKEGGVAKTFSETIPPHSATATYSRNDAAEEVATGDISSSHDDLSIGWDIIGLRFTNLPLPKLTVGDPNNTVTSAYITFTSQGWNDGPTNEIRIYGENSSLPPYYSSTTRNISLRSKIGASNNGTTEVPVSWYPEDPWENEIKYNTPELKDILNRIAARSDWVKWNTGDTGTKNAMSFILDVNQPIDNEEPKLETAQRTAGQFIDKLNPTYDQVGAVSFAAAAWRDNVIIENSLTSTYSTVKDKINAIVADGETPMAEAISKSIDEVNSPIYGRSDAQKFIVLLTDGKNNIPCEWPNENKDAYIEYMDEYCNTTPAHCPSEFSASECSCLTDFCALTNKLKNSKVILYTIGIGNYINAGSLQALSQISNDGNGRTGKYYYAGDPGALEQVYAEIVNEIINTYETFYDTTLNVNYFGYVETEGITVTDENGIKQTHSLIFQDLDGDGKKERITGSIGKIAADKMRYIYVPLTVVNQDCLNQWVKLHPEISGSNEIIYKDENGIVVEQVNIQNAQLNTCPHPGSPLPWFKTTNGDIYSSDIIKNDNVPNTAFMGTGMTTSRCTISPTDARISSTGWSLANYNGNDETITPTGCSTTNYPIKSLDYNWFYKNLTGSQAAAFPTAADTKIAANADPSGIYIWNGASVVIDTTILNTLKAKTANFVILVPGDLFITTSFSAAASPTPNDFTSSVAFIVKGNINIVGNVKNVYGLYVSDSNIVSAYTTNPYNTTSNDLPLQVFGELAAKNVDLNRSLKPPATNFTVPAENVTLMPKYFFTLKELLGNSSQLTEWIEKF